MRRDETPDWRFVGWHYAGLHALGNLHNVALRIRAKGVEHAQRVPGGFLYAANHTSWWDPIILQSSIGRPVNMLAKKELMNNRFNKWFFFDRGGCIPVDRDARGNPEALAAANRALVDGRVIGIFPEGTRHEGGVLKQGKTGVARLALMADVPIVPAGILTDRFWPRGQKWPSFREPIYMVVGEPLRFKGDPSDPGIARSVTDAVMARIGELLEEAKRGREMGADWGRP